MGCGTGKFLSDVKQSLPNADYYGLDISQDMLEIAQKNNPQAGFTKINLEDKTWPIDDQKFDLIFSLFMLHHLENVEQFLLHIQNIASENAVIFIASFAKDTIPMKLADVYWKTFLPSHQKSYSSLELENLLKARGFQIKQKTILRPDIFWCQQVYKLSL